MTIVDCKFCIHSISWGTSYRYCLKRQMLIPESKNYAWGCPFFEPAKVKAEE